MERLTSQFRNRWKRFSGAIAVLIIFLVPATRAVLGKTAQSATSNTVNNQQGNNSISVKSGGAPGSHNTVSPVKPPHGTTSGSRGTQSNHLSSSGSTDKPKGK
jgi:hypothetical protein